MSARAALISLGHGRRPAGDGLLGNCRLEWGGGEAIGEEAILASFRAAPLAIDGATVETAASAAWIGDDAALMADLYDGRVGRLWRLGAGAAPPSEPAVSVAVDIDLRQQRGDVSFRAADHPDLDPGAADAVIAAAHALLVSGDTAFHRSRAFVLRAFTGVAGTVALFALYRLGAGDVRTAGFLRAVTAINGEGTMRSVIDQAPQQQWTPRL